MIDPVTMIVRRSRRNLLLCDGQGHAWPSERELGGLFGYIWRIVADQDSRWLCERHAKSKHLKKIRKLWRCQKDTIRLSPVSIVPIQAVVADLTRICADAAPISGSSDICHLNAK
ncbi:hypothetical protein [Mameliella sp.]|uniref:hypothetical protein n=1 Tax=Mameliella sp. TaxID=1924940 RepID=UPI003BACF7AF